MVRATETAQLILESLPAELPTKSTDMLREGAPIEPEPPSRHWKPEHWVGQEGGEEEREGRRRREEGGRKRMREGEGKKRERGEGEEEN